MHPINITREEYSKAIEIHNISNPEEREIFIRKWEENTGKSFPNIFPDYLRPDSDENWTLVVTNPAMCQTTRIS